MERSCSNSYIFISKYLCTLSQGRFKRFISIYTSQKRDVMQIKEHPLKVMIKNLNVVYVMMFHQKDYV